MGTHARPKPKHLAAKLLAIRKQLGLSQRQIAVLIGLGKGTSARVCEYETGVREPPLFVLLGYARVAGLSTDALIDDAVDLRF